MQGWLNFWIFGFWVVFIIILLNSFNFVFIIIYSELVWISLYCYSVISGAISDDITLLTLSFIILGLAGIEFSVGFILVILFKTFNKNLDFFEIDKMWYNYITFNSKNLKNQKLNWNYKKN